MVQHHSKQQQQKATKLVANYLKILISILIVGFIAYQIDFSAVSATILQANLFLLFLALLFLIASQALAAYRWNLIMNLLDYQHGFWFYLQSYFKGSLFNQLLPTSIGGDAYRVAEVRLQGGTTSEAFFGVFIDRIVGLIGLLIICILAIFTFKHIFSEMVYYSLISVILLAFIGFFVLLALHKISFLQNYKLTKFFYDLSDRFRRVYKTPKRISQQLFLSILIHFLAITAVFGIGKSVGISEPIGVFLAIIPPAILLTLLPVSFAGWGVREGALVYLFMMIGVDQVLVVAMSLLYGILLIIAALPGLVFYLHSKNKYV